jgi:hypothetical protein
LRVFSIPSHIISPSWVIITMIISDNDKCAIDLINWREIAVSVLVCGFISDPALLCTQSKEDGKDEFQNQPLAWSRVFLEKPIVT